MRALAVQRALPEWLLIAAFLVLSIYVWSGSAEFSSQGQAWPRMLAAALFVTTGFQAGVKIYTQLCGRHKPPLESSHDSESMNEIEDTEGEELLAPTRQWTIYFIVFVAFAVCAYLFSFLTIIPLFIAGFMMMHGYRRRLGTAIFTALIVTVIVYIIFGYFANLPLTRGVLLEYHLDWLF